MNWKAIYRDAVFTSEKTRWYELPHGILCVIIYGDGIHRLIGADYYWVKQKSYGMVYDGSCCEAGEVWWSGKRRMETRRPDPVKLKEGLMLSDSEWIEFMEELDAYT